MKTIRNYFFRLALKVIAYRLVKNGRQLTPDYLKGKGWVMVSDDVNCTSWIEKNVKARDRVEISFDRHFYRVWHGPNRTFITCEQTVEWFEVYYLLLHGDNGRYQLCKI